MSSGTVVYTSCNLAYVDRASLLLDGLRRHQPEWSVVLVLVDELPDEGPYREELRRFDDVLPARTLMGQADFDRWVFGHDAIEACTAVKGAAMLQLLHGGADHVVYLDPDVAVLAPLDPVVEALTSSPVALTPHQLRPATTRIAVMDNEMGSLRHGVYNLGFVGASRTETGLAFARWWDERLREFCWDDPDRGLFTDQRWIDLAPVFFPDVRVLRDPGLNVASWNLVERDIDYDERGDFVIGDAPLRFFHFTKALGAGQLMTRRYAGTNVRVADLWRWYLGELEAAKERLGPAPDWAWGAYDDGTPVSAAHRKLYRERPDLWKAYPNPFSAQLKHWMAEHSGT